MHGAAVVYAMMNVIIVLIVVAATVTAQEDMTLKYASLVFRHGDRSPVGTYPNDPYKEADWPQGYGQLSWNGTQQHFELGRLIKKRYTVENNLIRSNYTRVEVYVRSTDIDRTLMSALSQLSGLFPPDENQKINRTIDWQPIPVHTVPLEDDNLLRPHGMSCPRYDRLLEENKQTEGYKNLTQEYEGFFRYVENATGVEKGSLNPANIWQIADAVYVETQWGRNPGSWVNDTIFDILRTLTNYDFTYMYKETNAREKQRLTAGNLVGQIVDRMQNKSENKNLPIPGTNLTLYSAHDTTVAAFLSALQVFDDTAPPYAATVFVELYSNSKEKYFVAVWYLNNHTTEGFDLTNTTSLLIPLPIPNCSQYCPLEEFMELTADVIPNDWEQECQVSSSEENNNDRDGIIIVAVVCGIGGVLIVMMLILMVTYVCRRRRRYEQIRQIQ